MRCYALLALTVVACSVAATGEEKGAPSSPVKQRVAAAERRVQSNPASAQAYNELAFALCRWARDNDDALLYAKAEDALKHSMQLASGNYEARKLRVSVLLGEHEFGQALKAAQNLNHDVPDDIGGWGLLVDSNVAMGNYAEAERDAQWILDLRPGSSLGFEKAAGLRYLFGDAEGSAEFFTEAYRRTAQSDADQRAWLLAQCARAELNAGETKKAEDLLHQASEIFPDSQLGLMVLAGVRTAQEQYGEAAMLLEQHYRNVPSATNLYFWAEALEKAGEEQQARLTYRDFELKAAAERDKKYNANLQLILFYTDQASKPKEALALAKREITIRHDIATLDAYAWALYNEGQYREAMHEISQALSVGVRDPVYFCHASRIASKAEGSAAAARFDKELATLGSSACPAYQTRAAAQVPR